MGFNLNGFDRLETAMVRAADVIGMMYGSATAQKTIEEGFMKIVRPARANVHKVKNRLRPAIKPYIRIRLNSDNIGEVGVSYKRSKRAHHAHLVENGHVNFNQHGGPYGKTPAHPFWAPALEAHGKEALDAVEAAANDAVSKAWK